MILTGIGSRKTPKYVQYAMTNIASVYKDHTWRSGGADGADTSFENGAVHKEIFLPWGKFNGNNSPLIFSEMSSHKKKSALELVKKIHPAYKHLSTDVKCLHGRNVLQVLGYDLNTLTDCVLCWTPDGANTYESVSKDTGGTGTAIKIASMFDVPVFNLYNDDDFDRFEEFMKSKGLV